MSSERNLSYYEMLEIFFNEYVEDFIAHTKCEFYDMRRTRMPSTGSRLLLSCRVNKKTELKHSKKVYEFVLPNEIFAFKSQISGSEQCCKLDKCMHMLLHLPERTQINLRISKTLEFCSTSKRTFSIMVCGH